MNGGGHAALLGGLVSNTGIVTAKLGKIFLGSGEKITVDFVGEVITCIRDKDKKIVSGHPEKIKKIYDTWVFSRDIRSNNPNWQLVNILT